MKRAIAILSLCALMAAWPPAALAGSAPASQFGFRGWPYRPCRQATACPDATARPSATAQPSVTARPDATARPSITARPSVTTAPAPSPTPAPSVSRGDYTTLSASAQEQKVWNLLNADRQKNGLSPLPLDKELSRIARIKAEDMRDSGYFAHESPTYGSAADMLRAFGYAYSGVGENIAHHATAEKAQAAFMSSAGHRRNVLGSQWTRVGVGVSIDKNGFVYVTELFAR